MPHIIIEHSNNVNAQQVKALMRPIHDILVESLPTELPTCKSRSLSYADYLIGDGGSQYGFIHVDVRVMPGRTEEIINITAKNILAYVEDHFKGKGDGITHQISVEVGILPVSYCKENSI